LNQGASLSEVSGEIAKRFSVKTRIVPMSEDACPTIVELEGNRRVHFEVYLARDGAPDEVRGVDLSAAQSAQPAAGVLEALREAQILILCPSNPVVSIGPILALPGVRETIAQSRAPVVAISPIVGGAPIKGPADRLMRGLGVEVSARGVAQLYRGVIDGLLIDERDAALAADIEAMGIRTQVLNTIMSDAAAATRLGQAALTFAAALR
jgi:LPPG:FO 2-phospho-L-lactate transferase